VTEETLEHLITSNKFQEVLIITNMHPNVYKLDNELDFDELKDKCLRWMCKETNLQSQHTCEIFVKKFPFACFPVVPNGKTMFFLDPLTRINQDNIIDLDTYQRLLKQEIIEMHTIADNPVLVNKEARNYYQILSSNEEAQLRVRYAQMKKSLYEILWFLF